MKIRNGFVSNSSTSSFIIENENLVWTKEKIEEILKEMLNFYNMMSNSSLEFDNVFKVTVLDDYTVSYLSGWQRYFDSWSSKMVSSDNKYVIFSAEDNSIPYELFDFIESKFDSHRWHLG